MSLFSVAFGQIVCRLCIWWYITHLFYTCCSPVCLVFVQIKESVWIYVEWKSASTSGHVWIFEHSEQPLTFLWIGQTLFRMVRSADSTQDLEPLFLRLKGLNQYIIVTSQPSVVWGQPGGSRENLTCYFVRLIQKEEKFIKACTCFYDEGNDDDDGGDSGFCRA